MKKQKGHIYHNVALKKDTYLRLMKKGGKGDSFDKIVSKILEEKKCRFTEDKGVGALGCLL